MNFLGYILLDVINCSQAQQHSVGGMLLVQKKSTASEATALLLKTPKLIYL